MLMEAETGLIELGTRFLGSTGVLLGNLVYSEAPHPRSPYVLCFHHGIRSPAHVTMRTIRMSSISTENLDAWDIYQDKVATSPMGGIKVCSPDTPARTDVL